LISLHASTLIIKNTRYFYLPIMSSFWR